MKVALVVPNPSLPLASDCSPPLGLASVAAYLRANIGGVDVRIFDGVAGDNVEDCIFRFQPDVVGVSATTALVMDAYRLADSLKRNRSDIVTVLGGPHASALPDEAIEHFDFVVVGDGEISFAYLVADLMFNIKPNVKIIQGQSVDDLDSLPFPAYDLLNMEFYLRRGFLSEILPPPVLGLVTSRGCPFGCRFCYNSGRKSKVRSVSAERLVAELVYLHEHFGVSNFFFQDDEFLINRKRLESLAYQFRLYGLDKWIRWGCQARVTSLNREVLELIEGMGCKLVVPGMESANSEVLDYLKCGSVKVSDLERCCKLFVGSKVVLMGNFIVGSPHESLAQMWESVNFFVGHSSLRCMILNVCTPFPGALLWDECVGAGLVSVGMDYSRLVPTYEGGFNVSSEPKFDGFLRGARRVLWFVGRVRVGGWKALLRCLCTRSGLWMLVFHGDVVVELFKQCINLQETVKEKKP